MERRVVYSVDEVMPFYPKGFENSFCSKMLVDSISVGSEKTQLNEFVVMPGKRTFAGSHPDGYDETYYYLEGEGELYLEKEDKSGYEKFDVKPGTYAFIKGGRGHYMINTSQSSNLVLLTVSSDNPPIGKGFNTVYDERIEKYGTSFLLKDSILPNEK